MVFLLPIVFTTTMQSGASQNGDQIFVGPFFDNKPLAVGFGICFYLALTFVGTFFSGALIAGLLERFRGGTPTVGSVLATARQHTSPLFAFALLTGTIGYILNAIEERVPFAGQVATWLVGATWAVASMFAIPVIVGSSKKVGPLAATKQSVGIIKKTWGENVILNSSIGLVALASIVAFVVASAGIGVVGGIVVNALHVSTMTTAIVGLAYGVLAIGGFVALCLLITMLSAAAKAAIYYYATTGTAPHMFEREVLQASFTKREARKVFSAS